MSELSTEELLTVGDAARLLGLSTDMVRKLCRQGRLPARRASNGYHLFLRSDVERLAEQRALRRHQPIDLRARGEP